MHQISWTFKCRVRLTPSLFLRHRGGCTVAWNTQGEKREYDEKNKKKKMLSMWVRMVRIADHFLSNSRFKTRLVENNTRWLPAIRHLDKSTMFVALLCGFVAGAVLVLVLDVFAIWYWLRLKPKEEPKLVPDFVKVKNPKDISDYCKADGAAPSESCMFLNLVIAFLWREWRDTAATKSYFIKKMNMEFQELLLNKAAGKVLQQISVKDYCLGDSLPVIQKATVMKIQSRDPDQVAQELDMALEIEYSGGFLISLDVDLIFGKTAYLAVKLNSLKGRLRLQFTRIPCTHWSFSFYEDPEMDIEVESQFNGKNLARLTNLIKSQIRKSIKRKHTLPRYKVRYKPFFRQSVLHDGKQEAFVHNSLVTIGKLNVEVMECSRLPSLPANSLLYCVVSVDSLPWKEDMPVNSSLWPVHEVVLARTFSGSVGVSIKQSFTGQDEYQKELVTVDTISPQSPASLLDIKRGDVLLAVNEVDVESLKQAIRLIKNGGEKLVFKLQRRPSMPVINIESREASDTENKEEEANINASEAQRMDFENSFNFDNVMLADDDSDGEEFVNIVVQELEQQIEPNDEKARKILRKVSSATRGGYRSKSNSVNFKLDDDLLEGEENIVEKESNNEEAQEKDEEDFRKIAPRPSDKAEAKSRASILKTRKGSDISKGESNRSPSLRQRFNMIKKTSKDERVVDSEKETNSETELRKKQSDQTSLRRKILHRRDHSIEFDSDSSDNHSLKSFEADGDGGWDNISQHTLQMKEEERQRTNRTSLVCSNSDPTWNESFSFEVEKQHKFLNICLWSKSDERYSKDVLIGYASISLMEIALESLSTTSGKHTQSFILTPSYSRGGVSRTSLRVLMPGLKPETCNGDVTLGFCYKPSLPDTSLNEKELQGAQVSHAEKKEEKAEDLISLSQMDTVDTKQMHDFMGTQFYFPTRCDYCQKKVWTKAAFQCRVCAMISHKKCISNAHSNTYCTRMGVRAKPPAWRSEDDAAKSPNDAITKETLETKDSDKDNIDNKEPSQQSLLVPNAASLTPSIRGRVKSSPQIMVRKNASIKSRDEINTTVDHPLTRSYDSRDRHDSLATAAVTAQEAGRELYSSLDGDDRKEKLEKMVQKLQSEIDEENDKQTEVKDLLEKTVDVDRKSKLHTSLRKSEERSQGLSLLMVQYSAALRECTAKSDDKEK